MPDKKVFDKFLPELIKSLNRLSIALEENNKIEEKKLIIEKKKLISETKLNEETKNG